MTAYHATERLTLPGTQADRFSDFESLTGFSHLINKVAVLEKKLAEQQDYTARLEGDYEHLVYQLQQDQYRFKTGRDNLVSNA